MIEETDKILRLLKEVDYMETKIVKMSNKLFTTINLYNQFRNEPIRQINQEIKNDLVLIQENEIIMARLEAFEKIIKKGE